MSSAASTAKLTDQKVLIFDVYATLVDWETGIYEALRPLLDRYPRSQDKRGVATTATTTDTARDGPAAPMATSGEKPERGHRWTREEALWAFAGVERELETEFPEMLYCDVVERAYGVLENKLREELGLGDLDLDLDLDVQSGAGEMSASQSQPARGGGQIKPSTPSKAFAESIGRWPIFPDTHAALQKLAKYFKLVVLSNVDRVSFGYTHALLSEGREVQGGLLPTYLSPALAAGEGATSTGTSTRYRDKYWFPQLTEGSKSPFSLIVTAQDTGAYKPALDGFIKTLQVIRTDPLLLGDEGLSLDGVKAKTMSVAKSIPHDIVPAGRLGMKSVWIERPGTGAATGVGGEGVVWTWKFDTLGDFANAVEKELGAI